MGRPANTVTFNFQLMAKIPFDLGFEQVTWDYLEAGQNAADRVAAYGEDIKCVSDMLDEVGENINVYMMEIERMDYFEKEVFDNATVPETLKIHQVSVQNRGHFADRKLSCYCQGTLNECNCHNFSRIKFREEESARAGLDSDSEDSNDEMNDSESSESDTETTEELNRPLKRLEATLTDYEKKLFKKNLKKDMML